MRWRDMLARQGAVRERVMAWGLLSAYVTTRGHVSPAVRRVSPDSRAHPDLTFPRAGLENHRRRSIIVLERMAEQSGLPLLFCGCVAGRAASSTARRAAGVPQLGRAVRVRVWHCHWQNDGMNAGGSEGFDFEVCARCHHRLCICANCCSKRRLRGTPHRTSGGRGWRLADTPPPQNAMVWGGSWLLPRSDF